MPLPPDDRIDTDDQHDHPLTPSDVDTDVAFADSVTEELPGVPFAIEVGFHTTTVERIDLERDDDETITDWIRDAVDQALVEADVDAPACDEPLEGRPADYEPERDMPDGEIIERAAFLGHGPLQIEIEFPAGVLAAMLSVRGNSTVGEWIRDAVRLRFVAIDTEIEHRPTVTVDVPAEVVQRARLRAQHRVARNPDESREDALREVLLEYVTVEPEYVVEAGEIIASLADDASA